MAADEGIENITKSLKANGLWDRTLICVHDGQRGSSPNVKSAWFFEVHYSEDQASRYSTGRISLWSSPSEL